MRYDMERKELEYYLNLRYPVTVHPDPESGFVAEIEELPGCMTQAETLEEVFKAIEEARQLWIKTAYDEGQDIPLPRDMTKYTGKFLVRIPRGLHRDLVRAAKLEGVSLNQYVTSLLASGVSRDIMGTQVGAMMRFIWAPPLSARIWGTTEEPLDYKEFLTISTPKNEVIEAKK
jgi:antitoxin HicB